MSINQTVVNPSYIPVMPFLGFQSEERKKKRGRPKKNPETSNTNDSDDEYRDLPKPKRRKDITTKVSRNIRKVAIRNPYDIFKPLSLPVQTSEMNISILKQKLLSFAPGKVIKLLSVFNCKSDNSHEVNVNTFINAVIPKFDNISKKHMGNLISLISNMETRFDQILIFSDPPLPFIFSQGVEKRVIYHNNNIEPRVFQIPINTSSSSKFAVIAYHVSPFSTTINLQPILVNHREVEAREFGAKHIPFYLLYSGCASEVPLLISLPSNFDSSLSWTVIKYVKWRTPEVVAEEILNNYDLKAYYSTLDDIQNVCVTAPCGCVFSIVDLAKQIIDNVSIQCPRCKQAFQLKSLKVTSLMPSSVAEGNITIKDAEQIGEAISRNEKIDNGFEFLGCMICHHYCPFEFAPKVGPQDFGQMESRGIEAYLEAFNTY